MGEHEDLHDHLAGKVTGCAAGRRRQLLAAGGAGLYPLLDGDRCCWLAADFDGPAAMLDALATSLGFDDPSRAS